MKLRLHGNVKDDQHMEISVQDEWRAIFFLGGILGLFKSNMLLTT